MFRVSGFRVLGFREIAGSVAAFARRLDQNLSTKLRSCVDHLHEWLPGAQKPRPHRYNAALQAWLPFAPGGGSGFV